jgi:transcription initiation factor TFIIE subunit beta
VVIAFRRVASLSRPAALTRSTPLSPTSPRPSGAHRKVQQQSAKISIDASKDRARLDARSNAQAERLKAAAELEAKERKERERAAAALAPPTAENLAATNWLMKQKRVMDLLHRTRKPMSTAELHNELGWPVDVPELWEMLLHNDKVLFDEKTRRFSYKAKHTIRDRREMLALIHKHPDGVLEEDVVDAYQGAVEDAAALIESGDVIFLVNAESRERVLYPVDETYEVHVDEDVSSAFHGVTIPAHDPEWDQAVASDRSRARAETRARRARRRRRRRRRGRREEEKEKETRGEFRAHEGDQRASARALQGAAGGAPGRMRTRSSTAWVEEHDVRLRCVVIRKRWESHVQLRINSPLSFARNVYRSAPETVIRSVRLLSSRGFFGKTMYVRGAPSKTPPRKTVAFERLTAPRTTPA